MKKITGFVMIVTLGLFSACGPSAEEEQQRQKDIDSVSASNSNELENMATEMEDEGDTAHNELNEEGGSKKHSDDKDGDDDE